MLGMILSACGGGTASVPIATGTPPVVQTPTGKYICPGLDTIVTPSQNPLPPTPTAITPQGLNSNFIPSNNFGLGYLSGWIDTYNLANDQNMGTYNQ